MDLFKAKFNPSVRSAIADTVRRYREISPAFAKRLNSEIAEAVVSIRANPFRDSIRYQNVRRRNLHRFPFGLFYIIEMNEKMVVFTNFFHVKQNVPYRDKNNPENLINEPETIYSR
jgi:hypothetical protein